MTELPLSKCQLSAGQNPAGSAIKITGSATDRQSREADTASSSELIIDEDLETESANGQDSDSLANGDEDNETKDAVAPHHSSSTEYVTKQGRKRKHHGAEDDLETTYMRRLAKEEASEEQSRHAERSQKRQKSFQDTHTAVTNTLDSVPSEIRQVVDLEGSTEDNGEYPLQHETLTPSKESFELEKSSRTVFLANVSISAIRSKTCKKVLLEHLASFIPSLSKEKVPHKVESIRFRSTAFSITAVPKKAAFAKRELMDATTRSTNAYAVYSTSLAAREAAKRLNGTMVLDRHLRVDGVAHPAKTDNRRCVFVGNLGFVDDESSLNAANDEENEKKPRKAKPVADVEEGLWRQFGKAGTVESVRVVRDKSTRVGKGIAYVQYMVILWQPP